MLSLVLQPRSVYCNLNPSSGCALPSLGKMKKLQVKYSSISVERSKIDPLQLKTTTNFHSRSAVRISASSSASAGILNEEPILEDSSNLSPFIKEKLGVAVKPMEKPRLVLKFLWMEKNIGLALDQVIPGHGSIPVSPYYFWPRKDAWEELKVMLEGKPWISQKQMIILLNQATDIINLWQQSGGSLV